jgi:outer membrane protein with beta-barrel domain
MKRARSILVPALCGLVVLAPGARSQAPERLPSWTIFAALNLANIEGPNEVNKEPLLGRAFGIALDWRMNSVFMFQPELQYTEKGYQYDPGNVVKLKLTYVEIPLLIRASTEPAENGMRLYGIAGPSVGMRRSCSASVGSASGKCNALAQNMSTMDFGLVGGFGLDFRIRSSNWTSSLRYSLGLMDTDKGNASAKTRALNLMLGWRP